MLIETFHVAHVVLAGIWLGGLVFTTAVVSPAFGAMKWSEAERVAARSAVGKQYARVGSVNLVLLALSAVHGAYFGRRLAGLARAERETSREEEARTLAGLRRSLQRVSLRTSYLNFLVSTAVLVLAIGARAG